MFGCLGGATCSCQDTPEVDAPTRAPPPPSDLQAQAGELIATNRNLLKNFATKFDPFKAMVHTCEARMRMCSGGRVGDSGCCSGGGDGLGPFSVDSGGIVDR